MTADPAPVPSPTGAAETLLPWPQDRRVAEYRLAVEAKRTQRGGSGGRCICDDDTACAYHGPKFSRDSVEDLLAALDYLAARLPSAVPGPPEALSEARKQVAWMADQVAASGLTGWQSTLIYIGQLLDGAAGPPEALATLSAEDVASLRAALDWFDANPRHASGCQPWSDTGCKCGRHLARDRVGAIVARCEHDLASPRAAGPRPEVLSEPEASALEYVYQRAAKDTRKGYKSSSVPTADLMAVASALDRLTTPPPPDAAREADPLTDEERRWVETVRTVCGSGFKRRGFSPSDLVRLQVVHDQDAPALAAMLCIVDRLAVALARLSAGPPPEEPTE